MKKSKFIILGITIAVSIIAIIIILNLSSNVQNAKIEQQEIASSNISEKQIYGTFKTDASWVKDPTIVDNIIDMAKDSSIIKVKILSLGESNFLDLTSPVPHTAIQVEVEEVLEGTFSKGTKTIYIEGGNVKVSNVIKTMNEVEIAKMGLDTLTEEEKNNMYISYTSDYDYELQIGEEYILILSNDTVSTIMASGYGIFIEDSNNQVQSLSTERIFKNVLTGNNLSISQSKESM
jgi:hypothetical protein